LVAEPGKTRLYGVKGHLSPLLFHLLKAEQRRGLEITWGHSSRIYGYVEDIVLHQDLDVVMGFQTNCVQVSKPYMLILEHSAGG